MAFSDKLKEYSATPKGKIVVVAAPVAVLGLIIAVIVFTMLNSGGETTAKPVNVAKSKAATAKTSTSTVATTATISTSETTGPPINVDYEVYETRDPFKEPESTPTASSNPVSSIPANPGSSTSTSPGSPNQNQVLTLKSINNQNGVLYANIEYGSTNYLVKAGDRVDDSPYQVTSVGSDSVTLLYGDDTVILSVGDNIQK